MPVSVPIAKPPDRVPVVGSRTPPHSGLDARTVRRATTSLAYAVDLDTCNSKPRSARRASRSSIAVLKATSAGAWMYMSSEQDKMIPERGSRDAAADSRWGWMATAKATPARPSPCWTPSSDRRSIPHTRESGDIVAQKARASSRTEVHWLALMCRSTAARVTELWAFLQSSLSMTKSGCIATCCESVRWSFESPAWTPTATWCLPKTYPITPARW